MKKKVIDAEAWLRQVSHSWMNYNLAKKIIAEAPVFEVEEELLQSSPKDGVDVVREEAERIAKERAEEDIDYNNAEFGGTTVYCAWTDEESEGAE